MRIQTIQIKNFRQLLDVALHFNKSDDKKDFHIILAKNGVGKTNILNAITWCLYEQELHLGDENQAESTLNKNVIAECRQRGGGREEMSVIITILADNGERITFKRTASYNINENSVLELSNEPSVSIIDPILPGGSVVYTTKEEFNETVHRYLPFSIKDYIFFDGEQLYQFFKRESLEQIKVGVDDLTQASYVKEVSDDLKDRVRKQLTAKLSSASDLKLKEQSRLAEEAEKALDKCVERIDEYKRQIDICDEEIELRNSIINQYADLKEKDDELKRIQNEIEEVNDSISSQKKKRIDTVRKYYIKLGLLPSVKCFYEYLKEQDESGNLPPTFDKSILERILAEHECPVCGNQVENTEHVQRLMDNISMASLTANILTRSKVALEPFYGNIQTYKSEIETLNDSIDRLVSKYNDLEVVHQRLAKYLRDIANKDEIKKAIDEREDFKKSKESYIEKRALDKSSLGGLKNNYLEQKEKLEKLVEKHNELKEVNNQIQFFNKCIEDLNSIHTEIVNETRDEMQKETFDNFNKLLWKKDTFVEFQITEDYKFRLIDQFGNQVLGSCSAAERSILALSFTLAIQNVSNHDSLLFIDTPLGRIDDENRENIIDVLLDIAKKKQVILTFTTSEYNQIVKTTINNEQSTINNLTMINGITKVE